MPKIDLVAKLLEAVAAQNWGAAQAVATRITEAEEGKGHHLAAQLLRGALQPNGHRVRGSSVQSGEAERNGRTDWIGSPGFLTTALTRSSGDSTIANVQLRAPLQRELEAVVAEWQHCDVLSAKGIDRRRKLLFHGPPGCGKSLTALALGNERGVPTYVVRIDAVIGAYLGQTALRIRELFQFAETTDCVLLLDEIDALGKRRGSQIDVGELDRIVISLMQELEHTRPRGLVIATSNLVSHLDEALFRRFDAIIEFPAPTMKELVRFGRARAKTGGLISPNDIPRQLAGASSYAEASRRVAAAERAVILRDVVGS